MLLALEHPNVKPRYLSGVNSLVSLYWIVNSIIWSGDKWLHMAWFIVIVGPYQNIYPLKLGKGDMSHQWCNELAVEGRLITDSFQTSAVWTDS